MDCIQFPNSRKMNVPFIYLFIHFFSWLQKKRERRVQCSNPVTITFGFECLKQARRTHICYTNRTTDTDTLKSKFCIIDEMLCMHKPHILDSHISWPRRCCDTQFPREKLNEIMLIFFIYCYRCWDWYLCYAHMFVCFSFSNSKRLNFVNEYFFLYSIMK